MRGKDCDVALWNVAESNVRLFTRAQIKDLERVTLISMLEPYICHFFRIFHLRPCMVRYSTISPQCGSLCLSRISLDFSVALLGLLGLDMTGKVMIDHTPR